MADLGRTSGPATRLVPAAARGAVRADLSENEGDLQELERDGLGLRADADVRGIQVELDLEPEELELPGRLLVELRDVRGPVDQRVGLVRDPEAVVARGLEAQLHEGRLRQGVLQVVRHDEEEARQELEARRAARRAAGVEGRQRTVLRGDGQAQALVAER